MSASDRRRALVQLAKKLDEKGYFYICPTPESHERTFLRAKHSDGSSSVQGCSLEDVFGWSVPIEESRMRQILSDAFVDKLVLTKVLKRDGNFLISSVRFSNLYLSSFVNRTTGQLYVHSSYPTTAEDAVFFGPDTYLFVDFILDAWKDSTRFLPQEIRCAVDVACGAGAGAIALQSSLETKPGETIALDLNPTALELGEINAKIHGATIKYVQSDLFSAIRDRKDVDLIVSNPPYIATSDRTPLYSAGGALAGLALPFRILEDSLRLLTTGGILILYTGVPITIDQPSHDPLLAKLRQLNNIDIQSYKIIQPDIFGEELSHSAYSNIGRIQAVGMVVKKTSTK